MSTVIPPFIFCPRCGNKVVLRELSHDEKEFIISQGYDDGARGVCKCGVVLIICHQPLPKSPSFSIFLDIYKMTEELYENILGKN